MIASGLADDDDDLRAMLAGAELGLWACWLYPVHGSERTIKVWNRDANKPPLDRRYQPVGCVAIER